MYPKVLKVGSEIDVCTPIFTAAFLTPAKRWKQPKCPGTDESINKMRYIHKGILFSPKNYGKSDTCYNMYEP